jgi:hypothetical protein
MRVWAAVAALPVSPDVVAERHLLAEGASAVAAAAVASVGGVVASAVAVADGGPTSN